MIDGVTSLLADVTTLSRDSPSLLLAYLTSRLVGALVRYLLFWIVIWMDCIHRLLWFGTQGGIQSLELYGDPDYAETLCDDEVRIIYATIFTLSVKLFATSNSDCTYLSRRLQYWIRVVSYFPRTVPRVYK